MDGATDRRPPCRRGGRGGLRRFRHDTPVVVPDLAREFPLLEGDFPLHVVDRGLRALAFAGNEDIDVGLLDGLAGGLRSVQHQALLALGAGALLLSALWFKIGPQNSFKSFT